MLALKEDAGFSDAQGYMFGYRKEESYGFTYFVDKNFTKCGQHQNNVTNVDIFVTNAPKSGLNYLLK